jgi:hypothetical protein
MKVEYPIFEAKSGTVISVYGSRSSICGYCRVLVLENERLRFVGGFRRYTDREHRVSWGEPVEWKTTLLADVTVRIVPEKPWMRFTARPDFNPQPE